MKINLFFFHGRKTHMGYKNVHQTIGDCMNSAIIFDTRYIFLPITLYKLAKIGQMNFT